MKSRPVYSWSTIGAILLSLFLLAYPPVPSISLLTDSDQYEKMSEALLTSHFYQTYDGTEVPLALSLRPPMYPLILLVAKSLSWSGLEHGIALTHLALCFVTLCAAPYILRFILPPFLTTCATGIALYSNKQVVYCHMSEFLSSIFLLLALLVLILWYQAPSTRKTAATTMCVSLSILTRFALLPCLSLAAFLYWIQPKQKRIGVTRGVIIGLLPLLLWATFNLHRLGSFSLSAHGGYLYIAAARALGEIPHQATDTPDTTQLITAFNQQGRGVSAKGWESSGVQKWEGEYYWAHHWNFDLAWGSLRSLASKTPTLPLLLRSIRAHFDRYLDLLRGSLYTITREYALTLLVSMLVQITILLKLPKHRSLALANIIMCACTAIYMGSIFIAFLWVHRYFTSVQPALMFSIFSGLGVLLYERFRRRNRCA